MPDIQAIKKSEPTPFIGKPSYRVKYAKERKLPFYHLVPKDRRNNLIFRRNLHLAAFDNKSFQRSQRAMCKADFLYWLNAYGRTYDPRISERGDPVYGKIGTDLPFISWKYQDDAMLTILECIDGKKDCVIHKSRDMGASWMILLVTFWRWLFLDGQTFLLISRKQDYVDKNKKNDVDSMFGKIDYQLSRLPAWMKPQHTRTLLYLGNDDNGSYFDGETTTSDSGRAGRKTAVIPDEYASVPDGYGIDAATADVADCRIFNSTPKGTGNAFYAKFCDPHITKLSLLWPVHPVKRRGAYRWVQGTLRFLDPSYKYPDDYPFKKDGKLRSPWYDRQETRFAHPTLMAQEVDGDFFGSDFQFFDGRMIERLIKETGREPSQLGRVASTPEGRDVQFFPGVRGKLQMWKPFPKFGRPDPTLSYVIGCDISQGTGRTPSVASIGCVDTGEQIAEFADANLEPTKFAEYVQWLCRWFRGRNNEGAFLIWEANGPGGTFGKKIWELGYRRFYYRKSGMKPPKDSFGDVEKPSAIGGWWKTDDTALDLFNNYAEGLNSGKILIRSKESLKELRLYVYGNGGKIYNSHEKSQVDPSGASHNHSDRAVAAALMYKAISEIRRGASNEVAKEIPKGSMAARDLEHRREMRIVDNDNPWLDERWT